MVNDVSNGISTFSLNINMEYPSLDKPKAGAIRFNTDSSQVWRFMMENQWTGVLATSPDYKLVVVVVFAGAGVSAPASDSNRIYNYINNRKFNRFW